MLLLKGLDGLKKHILQAPQLFRSSPILLVTGGGPSTETFNTKKTALNNASSRQSHKIERRRIEAVANACRQVQFLLQQQLALRCISVEATPSPHYPYPTIPQIEHIQDLASRASAGSSVIFGVGSGAAIDLTKALAKVGVHKKIDSSDVTTILIPATYTGVLVASSSHALLLDPPEATLVATESADPTSRVVVQLESKNMSREKLETTLLAAVAIVLDRIRVDGASQDDVTALLDEILQLLLNLDNDDRIWEAMWQTGSERILRYGTNGSVRSVPLAVAASLAPTLPHSVMDLMAGTMPYLTDQVKLGSSSCLSPLRQWLERRMEHQSVSIPREDNSTETLTSHVKANRSLHRSPCRDDENMLRHILTSMTR